MARKPAASAPAAAPAAPAVHAKKNSTGFVSVACKIPNGLVLQLCKEVKYWEETPGGARERKRFDKFGARYLLAGPAYPVGTTAPGYPDRPLIAGGYAITKDIPADFWDAWIEQNRASSFVENLQVFALPDIASIRDQAKERREVRSGFEPLKLEGDPRAPKPTSTTPGVVTVGGIEIAAEVAGRMPQHQDYVPAE
jgi:hypothetical protein